MTRRSFTKLWTAGAGAAIAPVLIARGSTASGVSNGNANVSSMANDEQSWARSTADEKLQSELLFDLVFERGAANKVASPGLNRVIIPVSGGTFEGPQLKGTLVAPSGDWLVARPDGSSVLDLRLLLQTDDAQKIYMNCRGIAYALPGGALFARLLPMFETGAAKYLWLNNVVAVGVYRPMPEKVAYRIYRIL
ncbi:MAG TPA: DUF3237 domain-containing protein [Pyrinomonadaceae bacterium]|nr:DUF3237 domain-containing protein [Pyrinomonadaceae bacterium]